jgi:hypothetical protein
MMTSRVAVRSWFATALACLALSVACSKSDSGGSGTPTSPTPSGTLTGTWRGTASDSSGPGQMTWQITQSGNSFTGTMSVTDTATTLTGRGSISGTVSGANLHFAITIPAGGFDAPHGGCTAQVDGDGELSGTSITGAYNGSNSCAGTVASGQLSLTKQ